MNLLDVIATLLGCEKAALHDYLNHPIAEKKITDYLNGRKLRTTYLSRIGEQKTIKFGGFSSKSSMIQPAYEGFLGTDYHCFFVFIINKLIMFKGLQCNNIFIADTAYDLCIPALNALLNMAQKVQRNIIQ